MDKSNENETGEHLDELFDRLKPTELDGQKYYEMSIGSGKGLPVMIIVEKSTMGVGMLPGKDKAITREVMFPAITVLGTITDRDGRTLEPDFDEERSMSTLILESSRAALDLINACLVTLVSNQERESLMSLLVQLAEQSNRSEFDDEVDKVLRHVDGLSEDSFTRRPDVPEDISAFINKLDEED